MNHIKHFIVGLKWLVIAQKVDLLKVICLCAGIEDLSKKNKNSSITFQCVLGRDLIVSEITALDFFLPSRPIRLISMMNLHFPYSHTALAI